MPDPLTTLAAKVERDPFFLAGLLADFAASEAFDDAALAAYLDCRPEDLPVVKLCRAPRGDPAGFRADTDSVARRFGLAAPRLRAAVRQGRVIREHRQAGEVLLAARDREETTP